MRYWCRFFAPNPSTLMMSPCFHSVASPAAPEQIVDTDELDRPVLDVTVVVFGVDEDPRVRIRPFELGDGARQLDGPVDVELGGKRVM